MNLTEIRTGILNRLGLKNKARIPVEPQKDESPPEKIAEESETKILSKRGSDVDKKIAGKKINKMRHEEKIPNVVENINADLKNKEEIVFQRNKIQGFVKEYENSQKNGLGKKMMHLIEIRNKQEMDNFVKNLSNEELSHSVSQSIRVIGDSISEILKSNKFYFRELQNVANGINRKITGISPSTNVSPWGALSELMSSAPNVPKILQVAIINLYASVVEDQSLMFSQMETTELFVQIPTMLQPNGAGVYHPGDFETIDIASNKESIELGVASIFAKLNNVLGLKFTGLSTLFTSLEIHQLPFFNLLLLSIYQLAIRNLHLAKMMSVKVPHQSFLYGIGEYNATDFPKTSVAKLYNPLNHTADGFVGAVMKGVMANQIPLLNSEEVFSETIAYKQLYKFCREFVRVVTEKVAIGISGKNYSLFVNEYNKEWFESDYLKEFGKNTIYPDKYEIQGIPVEFVRMGIHNETVILADASDFVFCTHPENEKFNNISVLQNWDGTSAKGTFAAYGAKFLSPYKEVTDGSELEANGWERNHIAWACNVPINDLSEQIPAKGIVNISELPSGDLYDPSAFASIRTRDGIDIQQIPSILLVNDGINEYTISNIFVLQANEKTFQAKTVNIPKYGRCLVQSYRVPGKSSMMILLSHNSFCSV